MRLLQNEERRKMRPSGQVIPETDLLKTVALSHFFLNKHKHNNNIKTT